MGVPLRVVARVRPPAENDDFCINLVPTASQILLGNDNFLDFDAVFNEETSQKELYSACLDDIINNSFHGLNATVIAYGQRGSGKTYTSTGPEYFPWAMNEDQFGLLPRALRHIFKLKEEFPEREYRIQISYLIIHQNSVYDLVSSGQSLLPLNVLEDNLGNIEVPGRTLVTCLELRDAFWCLFGSLAQKESAVKNGIDLTFSHSIFTLNLEQQWAESDSKINKVCSRLDFVDLAGWGDGLCDFRPRSHPGVEPAIQNSDFKAFRNVINCLSNKARQADPQFGPGRNLRDVPYNQSCLTRILKEAFGGNSLTLMICCLSPSQKDLEATSSTCKLASLARYILNYPTLNFAVHDNLNFSANNAQSPFNMNLLNSSHSITQTGNQCSVGIPQRLMNGGVPSQAQPCFAPFVPQQGVQIPIPPHVPAPVNGISQGGPNGEEDEIFRVHFAASQWQLLVSSAEDLLAEILHSGSASPTEKSRIQSWLCMKAEADDVIGNDVASLHPTQGSGRPLDVIEELSEPNDANESCSESSPEDSESELSSEVSLDEEFFHQLDDLKDQFLKSTSELVMNTESRYDTKELVKSIKNCKDRCNFPLAKCSDAISTSCENSELPQDTKDEPMTSVEKMAVSVSTNGEFSDDLSEENQIMEISEKDKENLDATCGSKDALLSSTNQLLPFHSARKDMMYRLSSRKIRSKPKIKVTKGKNDLNFEPLWSSDSRGSLADGSLADSSSAKDKEMESESELLKKVSSKFLSVSKGSSKCVDSLKSKSSQIKRSIKTHIFRKRGKNSHFSLEMVEKDLRVPYSSENQPCGIVRGSAELKKVRDKLQEINATIKAKEALVVELKFVGEEAETTKLKCQKRILKYEEELRLTDKQYRKAQAKLLEVDADDDEKNKIRKLVDAYHEKIKELNKKLTSLKSISALSHTSKPSLAELEDGIRELREQQEELQTKLSQESRRKKDLEGQIQNNLICLRKPYVTDESDMDEDENKENQLPSSSIPPNSLDIGNPESPSQLFSNPNQSLKRKLVNSTGDSQGKNCTSFSQDGLYRSRDRAKAGRLECESNDEGKSVTSALVVDSSEEQTIRRDISHLRDARDGLVYKRQKLDKRIKKDRSGIASIEEGKRLVELDETIEGIDCVIEHKNELLCSSPVALEATATLLTKYELIGKLRNLSIEELRILLIKYFNKVVDIRLEFRKHELDYAELSNHYDEQCHYISSLKAAYQQASLQMEHHLTSLHREYQYKISSLHRYFNKDSSSRTTHELRLLDLEKQLLYYKMRNREFKDKLREFYHHSHTSRHPEALPGPSGVKPRVSGTALAPQSDTEATPNPFLTRRGRRSAVDEGAAQNDIQMEVIREKNKLILQHKKEPKPAHPAGVSYSRC